MSIGSILNQQWSDSTNARQIPPCRKTLPVGLVVYVKRYLGDAIENTVLTSFVMLLLVANRFDQEDGWVE